MSLTPVALAGDTPALALRLDAGTLRNGVPASFTYSIVNAGSGDIRVPKPVVNCGDVYFGEIWVHVKFTPAGHTAVPEARSGCTNDYVARTPAIKRAESWPVLHQGESISQELPQAQLHYDAGKAGSYEIWAEYRPPYLSPEERQALRKAGIVFPSADMHTPHLIYKSNGLRNLSFRTQ